MNNTDDRARYTGEGELRLMEKPDWITYDQIHELLYTAHGSNRDSGFDVETAHMSGKELEEHMGKDGVMFVALDGDRLIGCGGYRVMKRNYWCAKGNVVSAVLFGVHPDYKGHHLSVLLYNKVLEDAKAKGYQYLEIRTAEDNVIVQNGCIKEGFRYVGFLASEADHYTVALLYWLNGCPYPKWRTNLHYRLRKAVTKLRYKKGRKKRFGV